jgi:predicted outer membrane repeat protein
MSVLRRALVAATALALGLAGAVVVASPASAAGCVVDNTGDNIVPVDGTLRYALESVVCPVITFGPVFNTPQTINLASNTLRIEQSVTIQGPGADLLTIQRVNDSVVYALIAVDPVPDVGAAIDVTINDLTLDRSNAAPSANRLGSGFYSTAVAGLRNLEMNQVVIQNQDVGQAPPAPPISTSGGGILVEGMTGTAIFDDVTFRNNSSTYRGGAAYINGATTLSFTNTTFVDNEAEHGGALSFENSGTVDIDSSTFEHNIATDSGGAIGTGMTGGDETVTITNTAFLRNESQGGYGGAIFTDGTSGEPYTIARSTFDGNSATSTDSDGPWGGALYINGVSDAPFTIDSSTFTRNSTDGPGEIPGFGTSVGVGGIGQGEQSLFFIVNSTFDEDQSGASGESMIYVDQNSGTFSIKYSTLVGFQPVYVTNPEPGVSTVASTIVQSAFSEPDLYNEDDPFQVQYSILSKPLNTLLITDLGNNQFSTDALLGPLQNNGGPTETRMPANNSPALSKGGPTLGAPDWDQRFEGFPRIVGLLDVGAVEIPAALPATGSTIPLWIPIAGGIVLLLGFGAIAFTVVARRKVG